MPSSPSSSEHTTQFVAAVAVIVRDGDRLLSLRRASHKPGAGLWEVVSGRIERGEEPLETAAREVQEETGLAVEIDARPITAYSATRAGEPMVVIVYGAMLQGGAFQRSDEHDAHAWLTPEEFRKRTTLVQLSRAASSWFARDETAR